MLSRILVSLDGSPQAEAALPLAAHLARVSHGTIALVRAIRSLPEVEMGLGAADGWLPPADPRERDDATAYLRRIVDGEALRGLPVEIVVGTGPVAAAILHAARDAHADLIVMTSRQREGLARWLLGSVAREVLRATDIPVLILRAADGTLVSPSATSLEGKRSWRALVALDGSALAEAALVPAEDLVAALSAPDEAQIVLLRAVELVPTVGAAPYAAGVRGGFGLAGDFYVESARAAREYLDGVADRLRRSATGESAQNEQVRNEPATVSVDVLVLLSADVAGSIAAAAEGRPVAAGEAPPEPSDLIAVATHGRSGLQRLILGSVTERLLDATALPVLVVPPPAEAAGT
jgi:nucleotide-binding universal stress UspA family protein